MKKLMFGLAIAAVGTAFAVESSNIVGYQTTAAGADSVMKLNQLNLMTPTFLGVSANNYKLGDIKLSGCDSFSTTLQFLNAYGATATATADLIGAEAAAAFPDHDAYFIYVTDAEAAE